VPPPGRPTPVPSTEEQIKERRRRKNQLRREKRKQILKAAFAEIRGQDDSKPAPPPPPPPPVPAPQQPDSPPVRTEPDELDIGEEYEFEDGQEESDLTGTVSESVENDELLDEPDPDAGDEDRLVIDEGLLDEKPEEASAQEPPAQSPDAHRVKELEEEMQRLLLQSTGNKGKQDELEAENARLRGKVERLEKENATFREQQVASKGLLEAAQGARQAEVNLVTEEKQRMEAKLNELDGRHQALVQRNRESEGRLRTFQNEAAEQAKIAQDYLAEWKTMSGKVNVLSEQLKAKEELLAAQQKLVSDKDKELASLKVQLEEKNLELVAKEEAVQTARKSAATWQAAAQEANRFTAKRQVTDVGWTPFQKMLEAMGDGDYYYFKSYRLGKKSLKRLLFVDRSSKEAYLDDDLMQAGIASIFRLANLKMPGRMDKLRSVGNLQTGALLKAWVHQRLKFSDWDRQQALVKYQRVLYQAALGYNDYTAFPINSELNHWVMAIFRKRKMRPQETLLTGQLVVYDSLPSGTGVLKQEMAIIQTALRGIGIVAEIVDGRAVHQDGGTNCGIHALANLQQVVLEESLDFSPEAIVARRLLWADEFFNSCEMNSER
jgi:hypothetical protein